MQTLLVLVAMAVERDAILDLGGFTRQPAVHPLLPEVYATTTGDRAILLACSGVGPVNAALSLVLLMQQQEPQARGSAAVLSLGVGGALRPGLAAGDLVVATGVIQHDSFCSSDTGQELMAPGALHLSLDPAERPSPVHACDVALTAAVVGRAPAHTGLVLSGSEFIGARDRKRALGDRYPAALIVDMESAGLAQVARRLALPLAVLRTVADSVDAPSDALPGTPVDAARLYQDFKQAAAAQAARVIGRLRATT